MRVVAPPGSAFDHHAVAPAAEDDQPPLRVSERGKAHHGSRIVMNVHLVRIFQPHADESEGHEGDEKAGREVPTSPRVDERFGCKCNVAEVKNEDKHSKGPQLGAPARHCILAVREVFEPALVQVRILQAQDMSHGPQA